MIVSPSAVEIAMPFVVGAVQAQAPGSGAVPCPPPCPPSPPPLGPAPWPVVGTVRDPRLSEISGVALSRAHPGTAWVHNDSGDIARVFAIGLDGAVRAEVQLSRTITIDAEDIALAPGPDGSPWLWLADTGNNNGAWRADTVQIYAFPEPDPSRGDQVVTPRRIDITHPDGLRIDVEALLMDPVTGDGLLVSKERTGAPARLLRLPREQLLAGRVRAELVGELPGMTSITAGDVRADGGAIVLRNYSTAFEWRRAPGQTLAQALLASAPVRVAAPDQAEAIGYGADGRDWISIPEGRPAPISRLASVLAAPAGRYDGPHARPAP